MTPSPELVGQASDISTLKVYANSNTLSEDDHAGRVPAGYYPGLFESYETPDTYRERRRWFHAHTGTREDDASLVIEMPSSRKNALNQHGHSEDRMEYRRKREWYYHATNSQQESEVDINCVEVHVCDSQVPSIEAEPTCRQRSTSLPAHFEAEPMCRDRSSSAPAYLPSAEPSDGLKSPEVDRATKQSWYTLCRAVCVMVLALSAWFSANSYLTEITKDYNVSKQQSNLLTVLVNVGFAIGASSSAIAQFPDRIPPSRLLSIGCLGCFSSSVLLATGLPFKVLLIARFLLGLSIAWVYPILMRMIAGWFPPKQRGFALGSLLGGLTISIALPSILKAALSGLAWRLVVLGTSTLALIACALTFSFQDGPFANKVPGFSWDYLLLVMKDPNCHLVTLSYSAHSLELWGGWAWIGAFVESFLEQQARNGAGIAVNASAVTFVIIALGSIGAVVGGRMADWMGKRRFILLMHLISGTTIAILPTLARNISSSIVLLAVTILWSLTVIADSAQYSAYLSEILLDKRLVGTAIAYLMGLGFIATATGIYIVPPLVEWGGWDGAFPCLALGPALGIICICAVRPVMHRGFSKPMTDEHGNVSWQR